MASVLLHLGPYTPCCAGKVSLENESISLHRLYATLNINLNPCSTSPGHGSEAAHHLQTSDMASLLLHHQQFGAVLIGTNSQQVCPWATGLPMGQPLCLPAREDSGWGARPPAHPPTGKRPGSLALHCAPPDPCLKEQRNGGQPVSLLASSPEDCLFASAVRMEGGD